MRRSGCVDRYVRSTGPQNAVNRDDSFETLGKPDRDSITPVDAPAGEPGRDPVGPPEELAIALAPAVLVFERGVFGALVGGLFEQFA
jgi:hypothetical protein